MLQKSEERSQKQARK